MRYEDWPSRLSNYLAACEQREFKWGEFDCALFAAGAVQAMTGVDPAADYRGKYDSALGAARLLPAGLAGVADASGYQRKAWYYAQRGDAALVRSGPDDRESLGVVTGVRVAVLSQEGGLTYLPLRTAVAVWGID